MAKAISLFRDLIYADVAEGDGIPVPVVDDAVRHAARKFCYQTQCWIETLDNISTVANKHTYDIEAPANSKAIAMVEMFHHSTRVNPISPLSLKEWTGDWRAQTASTALWFTSESPGTFRLIPYPTETETAAITSPRAALQPSQSAGVLPDLLFDEYQQEIVHGAVARLLRIPKRAWTNFDLSAFYDRMFMEDIAEAEARAIRGDQNAPVMMVQPRIPGMP